MRHLSTASLLFALAGCSVEGTISNPDGGGCARDADCGSGRACQGSSGLCVPRSCLTDGCDAGAYCDPAHLICTTTAPTDHPRYRGQTIVGHGVAERLSTRDAVGASALGDFSNIVASRSGRYLYVADECSILRIDQTNMRVETLSGLGWPGDVDGPADVAQFEVNFYQQGGLALSPDEKTLYVTAVHSIRKVDTATGEASTLTAPELAGARTLAVGASGTLYFSGWDDNFYALTPAGALEQRKLDISTTWGTATRTSPGYLAIDEQRGWAYALDRNYLAGALYRWPLAGGKVEWLNAQATGARDPVQYLSDGPVAQLDMANPGGLSIDAQGRLYIGAGDGATFRRYDPDTGLVESLCSASGHVLADDLFEWCIGDGARNRIFGTWPLTLAVDGAGNAYFGYTVWPRLIRLVREN